jgi:chromosomal replication initiator protein
MSNEKLIQNKINEIEELLAEIKELHFPVRAVSHFQIKIDPSKTFENFITGSSNFLAKSTCAEIANTPGKEGKYPSLYIHSSTGLGKTHLLHAVANELAVKRPDLKICALTSKHMMDELISLVQQNKFNQFVHKYSEDIDVLLLDDIQEIKDRKGTQDQFFHVFNELQNKGKQFIFTSDKRPKEINGLTERVKSRLDSCLVVDIQPPELETCVAILRNLTLLHKFPIKDEVLSLIAESGEHNPRELEGYFLRIKTTSELYNIEVNAEFLKKQMVLF